MERSKLKLSNKKYIIVNTGVYMNRTTVSVQELVSSRCYIFLITKLQLTPFHTAIAGVINPGTQRSAGQHVIKLFYQCHDKFSTSTRLAKTS